jgi:hypothetical protein
MHAASAAKAEDSIAYNFENYREEDGRITVETQSSSLNQDVSTDGHLTLTGTVDAVSGGTPTGRKPYWGFESLSLRHFKMVTAGF